MCTECRAVEAEAAEALGVSVESVTTVHDAIKAAMTARLLAEQAETESLLAALPEPVAEAMREEAGDPIPGFILEALVASVGGPVVIVGATPLETGEAQLTVKAAGTRSDTDIAVKMLSSAMETLTGPLAETGGVTEDGRIVFPRRRGRSS